MTNIDEAVAKFEIYKKEVSNFINQDLNESDTRSKLIDHLFIDVLGWNEQNIKREGKVESGYFDYHISLPGINFIVEAKRNFKSFNIPPNHKKAQIKSIYNDNKTLFDQIRGYAMDYGCPYGVLTNGIQLIVCKLLNIDGTNWKENQCLIFDGLESIENNFVDFFWEFSR